MKFKLLPCLIALCLLLTGCIANRPADDEIYPAERKDGESPRIAVIDTQIDTAGSNSFYKEDLRRIMASDLLHNPDHLIVSISPDHKSAYYMTRSDYQDTLGITRGNTQLVIKGRAPYRMDLFRIDAETDTAEMIASNIPVITRAEWNASGDVLALMGGNHLTLYNAESREMMMPEKLENEHISHFGWGPDGEKIFTEHPNLPNGSIIYVNSNSIVHKYENNEDLYYKGRLDDNYYYGTYLYRPSETELKQGIPEVAETVVIDQNGQMVKTVGKGLFRDAYERAVLQLGENHFGLYYTSDINDIDNQLTLTEEYIYDTRFIYDGSIAYIIKSPKAETNTFLLYIADQNGKLIKKFEITGNCLQLSPDGKTIFTKGKRDEIIDLTSMSMKSPRYVTTNDDLLPVYEVIRGAVDSYCKSALTGEKDLEAVKKYFIDTHNPEQWAYTDISNYISENHSVINAQKYILEIAVQDMYINEDKASVMIGFAGSNSFGSGFGNGWYAEFVKKDDRWYITGLSTFPDSHQTWKVTKVAEDFIADKNNSALKDKEVTIGQIQFWQLSEPHLAMNPEHANYCKIYLKVKENGEESIYKLVLHKDDETWKVDSLDKNNLSHLF
ncbi:MAG: hypothetical protein U9N81_08580 [Bacillota bacterium]|nr:hypothetical protein [Bacillota bacterium]